MPFYHDFIRVGLATDDKMLQQVVNLGSIYYAEVIDADFENPKASELLELFRKTCSHPDGSYRSVEVTPDLQVAVARLCNLSCWLCDKDESTKLILDQISCEYDPDDKNNVILLPRLFD